MQTCMSKNVVNCNSVTVELPIYSEMTFGIVFDVVVSWGYDK